MPVKKRKQVTVQQKHIDAGKPGYITKCPIALALQDAFKKFAPVIYSSADPYNLRVYGWDEETFESAYFVDVNTTPKQRLFMGDFDAEKPVEPFTFSVTYTAPEKD